MTIELKQFYAYTDGDWTGPQLDLNCCDPAEFEAWVDDHNLKPRDVRPEHVELFRAQSTAETVDGYECYDCGHVAIECKFHPIGAICARCPSCGKKAIGDDRRWLCDICGAVVKDQHGDWLVDARDHLDCGPDHGLDIRARSKRDDSEVLNGKRPRADARLAEDLNMEGGAG